MTAVCGMYVGDDARCEVSDGTDRSEDMIVKRLVRFAIAKGASEFEEAEMLLNGFMGDHLPELVDSRRICEAEVPHDLVEDVGFGEARKAPMSSFESFGCLQIV